jgi:hypothetical protein
MDVVGNAANTDHLTAGSVYELADVAVETFPMLLLDRRAGSFNVKNHM